MLLLIPCAASRYDFLVGWDGCLGGDFWEEEEIFALRALGLRTHGRSVRPARVLTLFFLGSVPEGVSAGCSRTEAGGVWEDSSGVNLRFNNLNRVLTFNFLTNSVKLGL